MLGEGMVNLMEWPINYVRGWLKSRGLAATVRCAAHRRATMVGCEHFDATMNKHLLKERSEEARRAIHMIQAGGLWTGHSMFKAGYLQEDRCPWCHGGPESLEHLWWECPAFEHLRAGVRRYVPMGNSDTCHHVWHCMGCRRKPEVTYMETSGVRVT